MEVPMLIVNLMDQRNLPGYSRHTHTDSNHHPKTQLDPY
jgi:hypothetical protein